MTTRKSFWPRSSAFSVFAARRKRLASSLHEPVLLASGWPRARNFPHNSLEYRSESHFLYLVGRALPGAALLLDGDKARLFATPADPRDRLWHGAEPTLSEHSKQLGLEVFPLDALGQFSETLKQAGTIAPQDLRAAAWLSEHLGRSVSAGAVDAGSYKDSAVAAAMIELRLLADEAGLEQMRQAAEVTARAHRRGMAKTVPGEREAIVCAELQAEATCCGMALAYSPIVTVRGQVLHSHHHHHVMQQGDLLLVDVGAETPEGWAADVTRTWPVDGRFSPTQRAVYEVVLAAELAAIERAKVGVRFSEVHRAAQDTLTEGLVDVGILRGSLAELRASNAITAFFPHGVGHLIGLDVHDMEDLGDSAGYPAGRQRSTSVAARFLRLDRELQAGMVVTVEPGFYQIPELLSNNGIFGRHPQQLNRERLAEFSDVQGIRIEDDIVIGGGECEILSAAAPKTVEGIELAMKG